MVDFAKMAQDARQTAHDKATEEAARVKAVADADSARIARGRSFLEEHVNPLLVKAESDLQAEGIGLIITSSLCAGGSPSRIMTVAFTTVSLHSLNSIVRMPSKQSSKGDVVRFEHDGNKLTVTAEWIDNWSNHISGEAPAVIEKAIKLMLERFYEPKA